MQKSITSFFAPKKADKQQNGTQVSEAKEVSSKKNEIKSEVSPKKNSAKNKEKTKVISNSSDDDSPIKTVKKRPSKVLSSDSEDEVNSLKKIKTESSIVKKKVKEASPVKNKVVAKDQKSPLKEIKSESFKDKNDEDENNLKKSSPKIANIFKKISTTGQTNTTEKAAEYNPGLPKYDPIKNATWKKGERVPYLALAKTFSEIEEISGRLRTIEILSNFLRSVIVLTPEDLLASVYLCLNKLGPAYEGLELGVAETSLMKAIAQSTGRTLSQIKSDIHETGDLGLVAERSRTNQRTLFQPASLTVKSVFSNLQEIAKMTGHASQAKKIEKIQKMFVACKEMEARFIIRSLAGKLRIGLAELSVLQALALACATTPPNQEYPHEILNNAKLMGEKEFKAYYDELALILKSTYCECPNYNMIMPVLLEKGIEKLPEHCKLTPGIPLKPMLAHPTKGVQEVLQRFDGLKFTCEWKYDGERAQIHIDGDKVYIYSRNQENNTSKYPDVIKRLDLCKNDNVSSCILDCEAVAWDTENKQILPFQVLTTRKRKDVKEDEIKVQVCIFMFDLLYFNGESLIKKPFIERRNILKENFKESEGQWYFAKCLDTTTMEEVQEFLDESVKGNCEGLMVKTLEQDATYEIAKRSHNWLKLKKDYLDGVGDTLDVVVIGGYLGKGKRTGTYGGFLLACYDQDNEEYQSICKIGTGFTDEHLQQHTEFLKNHIISDPKPYYRFEESLTPDHWFDTVQVWEIKCADLSLSPIHRAAIGIVDPEKGISLRFPRFIRIRDDKTVEQATSAQQVAELYSSQDQIKNQAGGNKWTEEDFY